jgi:predicted PurR-regulated permease PerM
MALVFGLREARVLLAPVVIAVVLTFVLAPGVRRLRRLGVPEVMGAALMVLALLACTIPLAASLAEPAAQWWDRAPGTVQQLIDRFDRLRAGIPGLGPPAAAAPRPAGRGANVPVRAEASVPVDPVKERLASEGVALTGVLLERGLTFVVSIAATVILLYFLLASEHWMLSRCVQAFPRRRTRALVLGGVRAAQREIGRYLFAVGCINAAVGAATALAVGYLGLANPSLWGVLVAVLNFIPYLGPMIIIVMFLLGGAVSFDPLTAAWAPALAFTLIHAVESNLVSPWLVGRRLALSPIAVFASVMFWGWLWGIAGGLIAVPALIALRSVCRRRRQLRSFGHFLEGDMRPAPSLRMLLRPRRAALPPGSSRIDHGKRRP